MKKAALPPGTKGGRNGLFRISRLHPLDLETIDRVYEAAWAQIIARDPFRNTEKDSERQAALRKRLFALAGPSDRGGVYAKQVGWRRGSSVQLWAAAEGFTLPENATC